MIKKNVSKLVVFTFLSRILGLLRSILLANLLGTTFVADAFTIAFKIPNLLRRLVAEGSMTAAFIPVFSDVQVASNHDKQAESVFLSKFYSLSGIILIIITLTGIICTPFLISLLYAFGNQNASLAVFLTRYMFFYLCFISLAAITQSVLNANFKFTIPAITPIILNISIISSAVFLKDLISDELVFYIVPSLKELIIKDIILLKAAKASLAFATGVLIGGFLQFIIQLPQFFSLGYRLKFTLKFQDKHLPLVGKLMLPGLFGLGIYQINALIADPFVLAYLEKGSIAALNYSNRLLEFTLGVFVISISTVILPNLSKLAAEKNMTNYVNLIMKAVKIVIFISVPATFGLIILREKMISLFFESGLFNLRSFQLVSDAILFHALGLTSIAIYRIYSPAFFALKDTKTPVIGALISMLTNGILCAFLPILLGIGGIALASSLAAFVNSVFLIKKLQKKIAGIKIDEFLIVILKSLLASCIMCLIINITYYLYSFLLTGSKLSIFCEITAKTIIGAGSYIIIASSINIEEAKLLISKIKSKLVG